ncbi:MAG TPA: serine/threonine-protein kinase [Actinomycetota bacterium]|nr:serine/threonine-protein kinase [Actinomycetota bacterium]
MTTSIEPAHVLAGRYALEEELGRSSTGMVWRSQDPLLRRSVAVKLIHPRLAEDPGFAQALARESRRVAGLSERGIACLLDTGEQDGVIYLVREYAPGSSLRDRLDSSGPATPSEAVRIGVAALRALAEAHDRGVLHLALDLDDVIVGDDDRVCLIDFGIGAAVASSRPGEAPTLLGDEHLAPEQAAGAEPDARTDVYAVASLLFELLTKEPPRGRTSARAVRPDLPRALDRTLARALDPDPERRFPDARAFAAALARSVETELGDASDEGRATSLFTWIGVPLVVAGLAIIAIAVGLWMGKLEVGGPLGIRAAPEEPAPVEIPTELVRPVSVDAIDPYADGDEHSSNAALADDGDLETAWRSENYYDGELGKPGFGLVLDLGEAHEVLGLRLWTPHPGFRFGVGVGDDPDALVGETGAEVTSTSLSRVALRGAGRYVLVWITSVVPVDDGIRAEVAEVRVLVANADAEAVGA